MASQVSCAGDGGAGEGAGGASYNGDARAAAVLNVALSNAVLLHMRGFEDCNISKKIPIKKCKKKMELNSDVQ